MVHTMSPGLRRERVHMMHQTPSPPKECQFVVVPYNKMGSRQPCQYTMPRSVKYHALMTLPSFWRPSLVPNRGWYCSVCANVMVRDCHVQHFLFLQGAVPPPNLVASGDVFPHLVIYGGLFAHINALVGHFDAASSTEMRGTETQSTSTQREVKTGGW